MRSATRSGPRRVGNLPADTTSFLGRRKDLAEVKRALAASRVVTLTGPGGVGKTRLALRVSAEVRRAFHDRVWFVELSELRDPALLAGTVAEQLGLHDQSARNPIDVIVQQLGDGPFLLVLDNCEQLVEDCAAFVRGLVRACPELRVLATSRQSLGLLGETVFPVAPFPIPDPDQITSPAAIAHYECVQLFVERASGVVPDFEVRADNCAALARICHDLDGIPLAIELTAIRLRALSLEQIRERLSERYRLLSGGSRGVPMRQRTLRALIDWSHDLCSERERLVWSRASVFSGGFSLDAAEHVAAGDGVPRVDMLDVIDSLVDKSILMREEDTGGVRYRMLQSIREYGEQNLIAGGEYPVVRCRHRDWFAEIAMRFDQEWLSPRQADRMRDLRASHSDLRVALAYCVSTPGDAVIGLQMITQLSDYWAIRGFHTEARHWMDQLRPDAPRGSRQYAAAIRMSSWCAMLQGDVAAVRPLLKEARELIEQSGDVAERAYLTHAQGMGALFSGDLAHAVELYTDAVDGFRRAGVRRGELFTAFVLGLSLGLHRGREQGLARLRECIAECTRLGDRYWRAYALWAVAQLEIGADNIDGAESAAKEALGFEWELENRFAMAFTLDTLAWTAVVRAHHERAAVLFGAAEALWRMIGASPTAYRSFAFPHDHFVELAQHALGADRFAAAFARGVGMATGHAVEFALADRPNPEAVEPAATGGPDHAPLTRREREVAGLVTEGLMNKEIAARLVISPRTVEAHVEHIMVKLGFTSRTQIATWIAAQRETAGDSA